MSILQQWQGPQEIKKLSMEEMVALAASIRADLIERVTRTGGHIGSNLGIVEATMALHYVFDSPTDKIVFDVSHQSYVHKMLTGRYAAFMRGETAGYTCPAESEHDLFAVGHTSTAVSLAMGMAKARDMLGGKEYVIAVVGDGSLSGGEAFEGLDNAAELGSNFIVLFNDNDMSIAPNVGGIYQGIAELRRTEGKSEHNLFVDMGLDYLYVADGNDLAQLIAALQKAKESTRAVVVHIHTQKGKGLPWAEMHREEGHWIPSSNWKMPSTPPMTWCTAQWLVGKMQEDNRLVVVNAATPGASGFMGEPRQKAGDRFVDVGICEPHAVAMVSGMARRGMHPVFMVFSSFVQRTYDQLMQDLALNHTPAVVLVYGGGFSAGDPTHVGMYDVSMIGNIPGLTCLAPCSEAQYYATLQWAIEQEEGPVVIRMPMEHFSAPVQGAPVAPSWVWQQGEQVALLGLGDAAQPAWEAAQLLREKGVRATMVACSDFAQADEALLDELARNHTLFVTLETGVLSGGFGQKVAAYLADKSVRVLLRGAPCAFVDRVPVAQQMEQYRLSPALVAQDVCEALARK